VPTIGDFTVFAGLGDEAAGIGRRESLQQQRPEPRRRPERRRIASTGAADDLTRHADTQLAALDLDLRQRGVVQDIGELAHQRRVDLRFVLELGRGTISDRPWVLSSLLLDLRTNGWRPLRVPQPASTAALTASS
jgi:hypothetical protein